MSVRRWLLLAIITFVVAAAVVTGWRWVNGPVGDSVGDSVPVTSADLSGSGSGSLVSAMTMPAVIHQMKTSAVQAARVLYRSTSGDTGKPTEVSGSVFVPSRTPPDAGWPVIAIAHGTTGIDVPCAPSLFPDLLGQVKLVEELVETGHAVAMADYQGLGAPGIHPYTDARTGGLNVIDSVRALRRTFPGVSDRWLMYGGSQGGGAAWAADEQAATYAPELNLVGAVAVVPAADVSGIVDKAQRNELTAAQEAALAGVIESLARLHPDINRDDFRRGSARDNWDALVACSGPSAARRDDALKALEPGEIAPGSPEAAAQLRRFLDAWALPQQPLSAPLYVFVAGKDVFIDPQWTLDAIARACAKGGTIEWEVQPDKGHGDVNTAAQLTWIADRFEGKPAHNDCP